VSPHGVSSFDVNIDPHKTTRAKISMESDTQKSVSSFVRSLHESSQKYQPNLWINSSSNASPDWNKAVGYNQGTLK